MMFALGACTGVVLFLAGFAAGRITREKDADPIPKEELEERKRREEQWDAMMSYTGRHR